MENSQKDFENILNQEDKILDDMYKQHGLLKNAVSEKNWENLTKVINDLNAASDEFLKIDGERDAVQKTFSEEEIKPYSQKISSLRTKLLKCKIENDAFGKYVNITKDFIKGVIDNALPQRRSKLYSRAGQIVQNQPESIVLSQFF